MKAVDNIQERINSCSCCSSCAVLGNWTTIIFPKNPNVFQLSTTMVSARRIRRRMKTLKKLRKLENKKRTPARELKRYPLSRKDWDEHMAELRPDEFMRRYRMPENIFNTLLDECAKVNEFFKPLTIQKEIRLKNCWHCDPIDPRHKLAAAIRWFAGGSHLDIRLVHGMSKSTTYECVWNAVDAINKTEKMAFDFPWDNEKKMQKFELGFATLSQGLFRGCVFSIDGFCVRIQAPRDVVNVQDYYHRKKFYAVVVQAAVDATGRFVAASFKAAGSTHDSLALKMSSMWERLAAGELKRPTGLCGLETYFGVGDDAYENQPFLVTPWPGRNLPSPKDVFNYWQSRLRIVVEMAFGRLTQRWGCLWRALGVPISKVPALVSALMKLHNLADEGNVVRIARADTRHFIRTHQAPFVFTNDSPAERIARREETNDAVANSTRECLTQHLVQVGATRPKHSRYRARTRKTARGSTMAGKAPRAEPAQPARPDPPPPPPSPSPPPPPPPQRSPSPILSPSPSPPLIVATATPPVQLEPKEAAKPKKRRRRRPKNNNWSHVKSRRRLATPEPLRKTFAKIVSIEGMHACMHACISMNSPNLCVCVCVCSRGCSRRHRLGLARRHQHRPQRHQRRF